MNETFQRILADFGHLQPELLSADPPVLLFHSFLSDAEADTFVAHGRGKYAESRGVGFDKVRREGPGEAGRGEQRRGEQRR